MPLTVRNLIDGAASRDPRDGRWLPVLPMPNTLPRRVRDAWQVLTGKAQAVIDHTQAGPEKTDD